MEATEGESLPVPPPFMFGCAQCTKLLCNLAAKNKASAGCFSEQLLIAEHIVAAHPDDVPEPHSRRCNLCPMYARRPDAAEEWAQHRTRGLFLPAVIARLM